ncbi:MAG: hypothetical protein JKY78_09220 [Hyphomonas sp.]|nr:hypothetical protein [Hyphomonas sp.]
MTSDMEGQFDWLISKAASLPGPALRVASFIPWMPPASRARSMQPLQAS